MYEVASSPLEGARDQGSLNMIVLDLPPNQKILQYILGMRLLLDALQLSSDVWSASLTPAELESLGARGRGVGGVSVVMVRHAPSLREGEMVLETEQAVVLNRGTTPKTVLILSPDVALTSDVDRHKRGDSQYLQGLPTSLEAIGREFLEQVRQRWPGDLRATPQGRFVDSPDNFWTVKIQPRDGSLRVTVRGEPDRLRAPSELGLKADRPGYSTFKIKNGSDIPSAIAVLGRAPRR